MRFVARAPWDWAPGSAPLGADLVLLSPDRQDLRSLEIALESGPVRAAAARFGVEVSAVGGAEELATVEPPPGAGPFAVRLALASPLKLLADGRVREAFDAPVFLRRLAWRVSAWAYFLEGLAWPALWPDLEAEGAGLEVLGAATRFVSDGRWSARQGRRVPRQGLVGEVRLDGVGPATLHLLRLAERCGVGGGASEGLGQIRIMEIDSGKGSA
ncbi:MAG: CRISPR system precrRNA processing endoribonuclease RAMP protein Cas6 [Acidobacteriota bacterium]|nr:CRISPR system precrRNA processing endoribonuclease RAMP protein Cas6 [Acidobacteriota bacterium]